MLCYVKLPEGMIFDNKNYYRIHGGDTPAYNCGLHFFEEQQT